MPTGPLLFLLGALFNLIVAVFITRFIYYPQTQTKSYVFTFIAFNSIVYFVLSLLTSTALGVGVGFGLFAIFSVLRYRTDEMPIREMTYMFILVALPVANSVLISTGDLAQLLIVNGFIIVTYGEQAAHDDATTTPTAWRDGPAPGEPGSNHRLPAVSNRSET